ncbi:MAG: 4Fe-4S dicluster domain-containing protein [Candidatus Omnitrophica bacterium]|nr:4Fe-4S dicluster domain-containing protein [Candidatus Omnitrophota bacterium]
MKTGTKTRIDAERCKGCELCISVCPKKLLGKKGKVNKRGIQYIILKDADNCTGCALCAMICPDCAIEIK